MKTATVVSDKDISIQTKVERIQLKSGVPTSVRFSNQAELNAYIRMGIVRRYENGGGIDVIYPDGEELLKKLQQPPVIKEPSIENNAVEGAQAAKLEETLPEIPVAVKNAPEPDIVAPKCKECNSTMLFTQIEKDGVDVDTYICTKCNIEMVDTDTVGEPVVEKPKKKTTKTTTTKKRGQKKKEDKAKEVLAETVAEIDDLDWEEAEA